ncbi:MAG: NAD(P)/FAD-dependent oxidoreductase [Thermoflexales bacterium]|nr:NAD(P)/FAD-dependent oxidoreductase [Thermoflexales bacterium]
MREDIVIAGRVVVVGAGAAGLMAASRAAEMGAGALLLEKAERPGKKLLISGKTRCNLSNTRELDDFVAMYGPNGRFLYSAFHRFFRDELLAFLRRYGVETKLERGGRIFPASDDARDVLAALERCLADGGVQVQTGVRVTGIETDKGARVTVVQTDQGRFPAGAVILATGGASYPGTGSTGDGYRMAASLGHTTVKLRPALVPLIVYDDELERAKRMQGVSLRNVRLTAFQCRADDIDPHLTPCQDLGRGYPCPPRPPVIESRQGEMMLTHFGLGGPIVLLMSLAVVDALECGPVSVSIDLKPALSEEQLRRRLQRDFERYSRRSYHNILKELLPRKLVDPFVEWTGVPPDKPGGRIDRTERERLLACLKSLRFNIKAPLPMSRAIVTAGGVSLSEVDPRTMASRLVKGLYLCGELLDLDADTGGYNLQAAFSTGYVAGEQAAAYVAGLL